VWYQVHRGLLHLVQSLRPLRLLESDIRAHIHWMVNAPLPQLAGACQTFADRLGDKPPTTAEALGQFVNDVEVSLGELVEARYEEVCDEAGRARENAEALAGSAFVEAERAFSMLLDAETRRLRARLRLLAGFDDVSNVADLCEDGPVNAEAVARVRAAAQMLLDSLTAESKVEWSSLTSALQSAIASVEEELSRTVGPPRSAAAVEAMCDCAMRCLSLLDGTCGFFLTFGEVVTAFGDSLHGALKADVRQRTQLQHDAVSRALRPVPTDQTGLRILLEGLAKNGIEVDESRRAPTHLGPILVDSGVSYLPPETISALVYALRSRASRGPLLKRDVFTKCVVDTLRKADTTRLLWHEPQRVARIAEALDPLVSPLSPITGPSMSILGLFSQNNAILKRKR
jgi:hypothetical protein